ncbi:MAG: 1,4-alpha-glucan branching protein domain-containing protein, partial [Solirubrobacteraceae bacterium]
AREQASAPLPQGGLVVCALDTELLGHWWYEGQAWLAAVVHECERQGLPLLRLDDALKSCESAPVDTEGFDQSSWGAGGDLSTWSSSTVQEIAFTQRAAELRLLRCDALGTRRTALRELMGMQASDWAFMLSRKQAAVYARQRFEGHCEAFELALAGEAVGSEERLRNLADHAEPRLLAIA